MKIVIVFPACALLCAEARASMSGIGIAVVREDTDSGSCKYLRAHIVRDLRVDSMYDLVTNCPSSQSRYLVGSPAINTRGTHVAFWRDEGTKEQPDFYLAVMSF